MGRPRLSRGLLATLLAALITLFGMTSMDAVACDLPATPIEAVTAFVSPPADSQPDETRPCGPACAHCQCHHVGAAAVDAPTPPTPIPARAAANPASPDQSLASRTPSGPDRPPQG
jgi:hypothetical protein